MRILIDHERDPNLGNRAMLWGITTLLQQKFKGAELCVVETTSVDKRYLNKNIQFVSPYYIFSGLSSPIGGGRIHQTFGRSAFQSPFLNWGKKTILSNRYIWKTEPVVRKIHQWDSDRLVSSWENSGHHRIQVYQDWTKQSAKESESLETFLSPYHAVVFSGGILSDLFLPSFDRHHILAQALAYFGKPCLFTGKQLGPFYQKKNVETVKNTLKKLSGLCLRDPSSSVDFCKSQEVPFWTLAGDDSLGLKPSGLFSSVPHLKGGELKPKEYVTINFRASFYAAENIKCLKALIEVAKFIHSYTHLRFLFVPISGGSWDDDADWGKYLKKRLDGIPFDILPFDSLAPDIAMDVIANSSLAIGVSYHFCTFALKEGVPVIHFCEGEHYQIKAKTLASVWGEDNLLLLNSRKPIPSAKIEIFLRTKVGGTASPERAFYWKEKWKKATEKVVEKALS